MIKKLTTILLGIILVITGFFALFNVSFAATTTCTPSTNTSECVAQSLGLDSRVKLNNFFPKLSVNDLVGSLATVVLALAVIIFGFRIILAGYKFVNNDNGDKSKKDAIKGITTGIIGLVIVFCAYFITLFLQSIFTGGDQLVQCTGLYYSNFDSYNTNAGAQDINSSTPEFKRCMALAGKDTVLSVSANYRRLVTNLVSACENKNALTTTSGTSGFVTIDYNKNSVTVSDYDKLYKCFGRCGFWSDSNK